MNYPGPVLVTYLKTVTTVTAIAGQHVYAGKNLPSDFKIEDGGAVIMQPRGGEIHNSGKAVAPSMQLRTYGRNELEAEVLMSAVVDALDHHAGDGMVWAELENFPTPLRDPETGWDYQLGFFKVYLQN